VSANFRDAILRGPIGDAKGKRVRTIQELTRYKAWADDLLMAALSRLPANELAAPRAIVFGSILRTLNHVYAMDHVWRCHLEGRLHGLTTRNPKECPALEELREMQRQMDVWYVGYGTSLGAEASDEVIDFTFIGGGAGSMSRGEIVLHVVNHTTYHRGHIADMMYNLGVTPPTTDLPVYWRSRETAGT
jgi:uncharacterized damage-inducible protein DinB